MPDRQNSNPREDDKSPNAAEAWALINSLLNDTITDNQRMRLEMLAATDPAVARIYVRVIHLWTQLPLHLGSKQQIPSEWQTEASNELLSETLVMEALKLSPENQDHSEDEIFKPAAPLPARKPTVWQRIGALPKWMGIAAVLILSVSLTWYLWPQGAPAVVTATAGVSVGGANGGMSVNGITLSPGSKLPVNQEIDIERGAIELRMRQGAMVTIAAPARFSLQGQKHRHTAQWQTCRECASRWHRIFSPGSGTESGGSWNSLRRPHDRWRIKRRTGRIRSRGF